MTSSLIFYIHNQNYWAGSHLLDFSKLTCPWKNDSSFHPVPKLGIKKSNIHKCQLQRKFAMATVPWEPVVADFLQLATPKGVISFFKNIRAIAFICDCYSLLQHATIKDGIHNSIPFSSYSHTTGSQREQCILQYSTFHWRRTAVAKSSSLNYTVFFHLTRLCHTNSKNLKHLKNLDDTRVVS